MTDQPDTIQVGIEAEKAWRNLANLIPLLQLALEPRRGKSEIRTAPQSTPPIDINASKLLADITDEAGFYVHILTEETHDYQPPPGLAPTLRSLADRHGHFTTAQDRTATDFMNTAQTLVSKALGLIERPPPPAWMGPCSQVPGCEGALWLKERRHEAICDTCGSMVDLGTWREGLQAALESWIVRRTEIAPALKMLDYKTSPSAVDKWVQRGRLVPVIREPQMFRFTDALALAEKGKPATRAA